MTRTRKNGKNGNNPKKKMRQPKRGYYYQFLIAVAFIVTALCIGTSSFVREVDMIHVGDVALKRYVAPRDAVDEAATEKLRTAAANSVGPIYKNDVIVEETSANEINEVFQALNDVLRTLSDENNFFDEVEEVSLTLPVALTNSQLAAYEGLIRGERLLFAEDCVGILNQIYSEGVTADSLQKGKDMASEKLAETRWADELKEMADALIVAAMEPNLVLDEDAMEVAREQKRVEVADILVRANQKIVDEGEIITQDIYDRLIGLKLIDSADFQNDSLPILGSLILLALVFLAVYLYFLWDNGTRRWKKSEMSLLCTVYVVSILTIRLMSGVTYFTLLPVALFAMLVSLLLQPRTAMILQSAFVISAALIVNGTEEFLIFALISGLFGAIIIRKTEVRVYLMPAALAMAALNFLTMMAVGLFFREGYSHELLLGSAWGALIGLMSVIIVVGSLPFWEGIFEVNTPLRLADFTNLNNPLLRRLMVEAPGTHHHSLVVANLAETAIFEIGGDATMARAGAYYHDVGKLKYPVFFSENQTGYNHHDELDARTSAKMIIEHTQKGVELGKEAGLPQSILNIIQEHQGTSLVKFFYYKALKAEGADAVDEADFRYPGPIPSSRESAVVMLADVVEAATRAILTSGKPADELEEIIKGLIKDKLHDGQLDHSQLRLDELETIRKAFLRVLSGMYHDRIMYPKQEEIEAAKAPVLLQAAEESEDDGMDRQSDDV